MKYSPKDKKVNVDKVVGLSRHDKLYTLKFQNCWKLPPP